MTRRPKFDTETETEEPRRIVVRLPRDLWTEVEREAHDESRTISAIVIRALREYHSARLTST